MASNLKNLRSYTQKEIDEIKSRLPWRVRLLCWAFKEGSYLTRRSDGRLNRRLASCLQWWFTPFVPARETPNRGVYSKDAVIDHANGVWVRLFIPVQQDDVKEGLPVVMYFHGGGFCDFSSRLSIYDRFCRRLAEQRRVVVVSVDYRLAPEHKFPAAYDDCFAALSWLKSDDSRNYLPPHADLSRCFLMGESAGGNIVHHVGCRVAEGKEDLGGVRIVGQVLIQPYFGGEERTPSEINVANVPLLTVESCDWYWKAFLPEGADRDHPAANVVGPNAADISAVSMPPSLVVIGGLDTLRDWQGRYFAYLKRMGKEVEILFYDNGFHGFSLLHLSSKFIDDLSSFMQR